MRRITNQSNRAEFEAIINSSANDLELFAQRIEVLFPDYRRDLELIAEAFDQTLKSLDPSTNAGRDELQSMRREAQKFTPVDGKF